MMTNHMPSLQPLSRIRTRTLWLFCSALFVVFFLMSWSSYYVAQHSINRQIEENSLPLTSDNVYSHIQRDLVQPIFVASLMAHDTFVRDWALQDTPGTAPMQRYLAEIDRRFGTVVAFFVLDRTRKLYLPDDDSHIIDTHSPRYDWYEQVKALPAAQSYLVTVGEDPERPGKFDILIDHKVFDYQNRLIGVTGVGLPLEQVRALIDSYQQRYQRTIYFTDRDGRIVLGSASLETIGQPLQAQPDMQPLASRLLSSPSGSYSIVKNGGKVYINARLVPEFDWYLIVEEHVAPSHDAIFRTFLINVAIAAAITLLVLGISLLTQGRYQRRLTRQASVDPLTEALNRRSAEELHARLRDECQRRGAPLSILVLDVDHFKQINDRHGHPAGDRVLRHLVDRIRQHMRDGDAICRWGGEEFVLLLNGCNQEGALALAERIRLSLAQHPLEAGELQLSLTISGGITETRHNEPLGSVVQRADTALYAAKHAGRNRIHAAPATLAPDSKP